MKRTSFKFDHPHGFTAPLSHADYFTEPLSLASGLADCTGTGTPGTFGKRNGKLRKVKSRYDLNSQRWAAPEGQGRAARTDRLLAGSLAVRLAKARDLPLASVAITPPRPQRVAAHRPDPASLSARWILEPIGPLPECGPPLLREVWHGAPVHTAPLAAPAPPPELHVPDAPPPAAWREQVLAQRPRTAASLTPYARQLAASAPAAPATTSSAWGASSWTFWSVQADLPHLSPASKRRPA